MSLALSEAKCQSSAVRAISVDGDVVTVPGDDRVLTYRPRRVTVSDGTFVMHESRGGTLSSVWATDLGDRFVEVVHLGHGPSGGELVLVLPDADLVAIGDLYRPDAVQRGLAPSWPAAVDLAVGLTRDETRILTSSGEIRRPELESFHQHLLGVLHG
ncbi:MAG: hypothetical protein PGN07_07235 [Aeromicrobium erythreum]